MNIVSHYYASAWKHRAWIAYRDLTLSRILSSFMTLAHATPAAQLTAFPAYVPPMLPGGCLSASSFRVTMPDNGKPCRIEDNELYLRLSIFEWCIYIGDSLCHYHDVGFETRSYSLDGEVCSASSKPTLDFIDYKHNAFAIADFL